MATNLVHRSLPRMLVWASFLTRNISTSASHSAATTRSPLSLINRLRPLVGAISATGRFATARYFSTNTTSSSLRDPNPNWSNRPPKETILLDGCDFEHWLVVMDPPEGEPTRDEIIDSYIKTLATVVGSEQEARMKIYSVSTQCYYAFGALVSEDISYKIKELPKVRWVLPDSYLDVKNKDYGGEPFINGQAVPYDPKYHEEWKRNNARANERNRRNDRPRNFDRSRNYERRRENTQMAPPTPNNPMQNAAPNTFGMPPNSPNMGPSSNMSPNNYGGPPPPNSNYGGPPPPNSNFGGPPPPNSNFGGPPPPNRNFGGPPPPNRNFGGPPPPPHGNFGGPPPPQSNFDGPPPPRQNNYGPPPSNNYGGPPSNMGGAPPNMGGGSWPSNAPDFEFPNTNRT